MEGQHELTLHCLLMAVQALCMQAGLDNKPALLRLSEQQILDEQLLEDISMLLGGRDIPGLLDSQDAGRITAALQNDVPPSVGAAHKV